MKLTALIKRIENEDLIGVKASGEYPYGDPEISSISYKADQVKPGGIFVAIKGLVKDGHDFIDEAINKGAKAIIVERPVDKNSILIQVANSRRALAMLSAEFCNNPSEKLFVVGITGTNGKTTVSYLIENILIKAEKKVGVIGTVNYRYAGKTFDSTMTTPESLDLQEILSEMVKNNVTHAILEISSHAIDMHRVDGCWIDVGVFTNLSQDHLDYHGSMDSYWACKKKLFLDKLSAGPKKAKATAVINTNSQRGKELLSQATGRKISTGFLADNTICPDHHQFDLSGISGVISTPLEKFDFKTSLVGSYNLENVLSAAGAAFALGVKPSYIRQGINDFPGVPGRLERIVNKSNRSVFVDYAHTPDALKNVLSALKSITPGRIITVFGCGGDRDKTKRPQMGEIGARLSDLCVITSDNPRTEAPMDIIDQIVAGVKKVSIITHTISELEADFQKRFIIEPDRKRAIEIGVRLSKEGDSVLIAGKGHETYQIIGKEKKFFDDRVMARNVLEKLEAEKG